MYHRWFLVTVLRVIQWPTFSFIGYEALDLRSKTGINVVKIVEFHYKQVQFDPFFGGKLPPKRL